MAARAYIAFVDGFRLISGTHLNNLFTGLMSATGMNLITPTLTNPTITGSTSSAPVFSGLVTMAPQLLTAAGTTQGAATAITSSNAIITVAATASTHGVKLPTATTGKMVWVSNLGAFGAKVYAFGTGQSIGAGTTCTTADTVLAINKANLYIARNTTKWVVQRGA